MKEKAKVEEEVKAKSDDNGKEGEQAKGVPGFWLTIFKNVEMLAEMVQASSVNYCSMPTHMKLCFKRDKCWSVSSDLLFSPGMFDPHQSDGIRALQNNAQLLVCVFISSF